MSKLYKKYVIDGDGIDDLIQELGETMSSIKEDDVPERKRAVACAMGFLAKDDLSEDEKTFVIEILMMLHEDAVEEGMFDGLDDLDDKIELIKN